MLSLEVLPDFPLISFDPDLEFECSCDTDRSNCTHELSVGEKLAESPREKLDITRGKSLRATLKLTLNHQGGKSQTDTDTGQGCSGSIITSPCHLN